MLYLYLSDSPLFYPHIPCRTPRLSIVEGTDEPLESEAWV
jgi:hypothetical protein